jgi:hypothetical protein
MAVTNHPKHVEKLPAWAQRGKLRIAQVEGGPSSAAEMILLEGWDCTPAKLLISGRYGPELVDELVAKKVNAVILTWSPGFSHEGDAAQWEIVRTLLPLLKKKKIKAVARISLSSCFKSEMFPRVPEAKEWLKRSDDGEAGASGAAELKHMDTANPGWRAYLTHKAKAAIDAGFDGIFFDDYISTPAARAELQQTLTQAVSANRAPDAGALIFGCDSFGFPPLSEMGHFHSSDYGQRPGFTPTGLLQTNLEFYKLVYEAGGRDKPFSCGLATMGEIADSPKARALSAAEILSCGGILHDLNAPLDYLKFQEEIAPDWSAADPVNSIGVLFCDISRFGGIPVGESVAALLARHNIQFDLIPVSRIQHFDLKKYGLICALTVQPISTAVASALKTFVADHGGTLMVSPFTGIMDETGAPREKPIPFALPADLPERSETREGAGRLLAYAPKDDVYDAQQAFRPEAARVLIDDVRKFGTPHPIEVTAADGVVALLWGKGTRRWVHILNYRGELSDATIALPGCGGREISVASPDAQKPALTVIETGHAKAAFSVSGVETYCVVEVR